MSRPSEKSQLILGNIVHGLDIFDLGLVNNFNWLWEVDLHDVIVNLLQKMFSPGLSAVD